MSTSIERPSLSVVSAILAPSRPPLREPAPLRLRSTCRWAARCMPRKTSSSGRAESSAVSSAPSSGSERPHSSSTALSHWCSPACRAATTFGSVPATAPPLVALAGNANAATAASDRSAALRSSKCEKRRGTDQLASAPPMLWRSATS